MHWHAVDVGRVLKELKVNQHEGLSSKEAGQRLNKYGFNRLESKKNKSLWKKFLEQISNFMVIVLLFAALISYIVATINHESDIFDPIMILIIVIINSIIGIIQESKAEKAIEALQKLSSPTARAIRNGSQVVIKYDEIVPGDIIVLEPGDFVPADARLIESNSLRSEEAALTGESLPVEKDHRTIVPADSPIGDRKNMVFSSCIVTSGRARAAVVQTGMNTQVGHIAKMINIHEAPQTPLQKRLEGIGRILGLAALSVCVCIFIMGVIQQRDILEMFMISVSLAVAAIPEGLPAIVTIVLAMGVQRMAKNNAIVRKLPAVETLGSATVICSDKTGTLTQNKMTVMETADSSRLTGLGGSFVSRLLGFCALCNNSIVRDDGMNAAQGDPTETALVHAAHRQGIQKTRLDREMPRCNEIPFDPDRKMMTTLHRAGSRYRAITKGAPEALLKRCAFFEEDGKVSPLSELKRERICALNEQMTKKALRVLAVAYRDFDRLPVTFDSAAVERDLIFCGLVGMIDPPRPEVKKAVETCRRAGIKPVMITGDHVATAVAIAGQLGIAGQGDGVITGEELDRTPQSELNRSIQRYSVFARVSPEHKAKIVKAFQANGHVVAMTGDGVNDAPALKIADIGCAMGVTGTDVAKGAADMILTDDNFATIVEAVREGRGIYQNIRKAIHFLLSSNLGEIITIFTAFFAGLPSPLLPIQLLWVNLVTDSLPALALGVDTNDDDIMDRKPIKPNKSLFSDGLSVDIILQGIMIGALALLAFTIGKTWFDAAPGNPVVGRTMAFCVLSLSQLVHAFNVRSQRSLFDIGVFSNMSLVASFLICGFLQVIVVSLAPVAAIFKVVPLNFPQWACVSFLSLFPLILVEIGKAVSPKSRKKRQALCAN